MGGKRKNILPAGEIALFRRSVVVGGEEGGKKRGRGRDLLKKEKEKGVFLRPFLLFIP